MDVKPQKREITEVTSYFSIFRYGTWLELTATILGILLGLLSGGGVSFTLALVCELTTSFLERSVYQDRLSTYLPVTTFLGGGRRLINASNEENMAALLEDAKAIAVGEFSVMAIALLLSVLSIGLISWSALRQITRIRMRFLNAVLRQDMTWYDTDTEFNLASKMSENLVKMKVGMSEKLGVVSNLLGTCILCLCTAFPLGWELALACVSVMPFSLAASITMSKYQSKSSFREMESYSQSGKQAEEVLKSVRTVVAFAGEEKEAKRYQKLLEPAENYGKRRGLYTGLGNGFNWVLSYSLNVIGLAYGARLVIRDFHKDVDERNYVVGVVFNIMFSVYLANQSLTFCVPHVEAFANASAAATSIFKLMNREPKIDSMKKSGLSPRRVKGDIDFNEVHFNYPSRSETKILKGLSLSIKAGECVALVGSSGCGKSTILQLLQRLYDPSAGTVKLDGKDIKNLNLGWLRSSLGVVGQEPVLFRGTIHENIAIGCPEATREDVQRVAEIAYAHDFIIKLRNGYDTVIGERGATLSGGQKQRVAIARSLLREPAVLLLDEATSALDPHSERQVQAALDAASQGRTTIMVSHRLSTIVNADRIICMDQGAIVEEGLHDELMKKKGFYHTLVTRGNENKEPEETVDKIDSGEDGESEINALQVPGSDLERRSTRRMSKQHSSKRNSLSWVAPRGSLSSAVSAAYTNFGYNDDDCASELGKKDASENSHMLSVLDLLKLNSPEWKYITVGCIAAFIQGICFPLFAILIGYTTRIFAIEDHEEMMYLVNLYSVLYLVLAFIAGTSICLQSTTFTTAGLKMTSRLRYQYFSALLRQEIGYYDKASNTVGAICARLSGDTSEVQGATGLRLGLVLQGFSSITFGFLIAICYSWKLTLVAVAFLPIKVGSILMEGVVSKKSLANERVAMETATSIATEAFVSIKTVQSLGIEQIFLDQFQDAVEVASKAVAKQGRFRGLVFGMSIFMPFISFACSFIYGVSLISTGEIDYKTTQLVTLAIMYGAYMLGHALVNAPSFASAKACGSRIISIINREPKLRTESGIDDQPDWAATGDFSIKDVKFAYPTRPNQQVLRGIDLKVDAGKTVALVGSSGCGKSTILQLMQRFYDPDTGNIELDGRDTRSSLTLPRLRRQLGVVQQEPVLFDRTLAENIAYGDNYREITMHEIVAAAKAANIHSFIVSLPKGYDTKLGSGGAQLSGGQKQRVCIARALIRSPRLLLLDEATSALDANSERTVSEALEKAAKGRTCITIAHRLSTIKDADLICVLHKGRIVEKGTHYELISMKGYYWRLSRGQNMA